MSGFTDMFGASANTPIGKFNVPGALPNGGTSVGGAPKQPVGKMNGGGLAAFLFNNVIQPSANSIAGGLSDIPRIGESVVNLGKIAAGEATGNKTAVNNAVSNQNAVLNSSNFRQNFEDPNIEKALGKTTGQVLNLAAPSLGGEALAGKTGLQAVKAGVGVGAKVGAVGGAAGSAAQGGNAADVTSGAVSGLEQGALAGGVGGGVAGVAGSKAASSVLSKLSGKGAAQDVAGAGADTASGNVSGGLFPKAAAKAGQRAADNTMAQQATDFAGATKTDLKGATSYDKQGNPVGLRQVSGFLRGVDMPAHAQNMETLNETSGPILGGTLQDMTQGVTVDGSKASTIGRNSIIHNLGNFSKGGETSSTADMALRNVRQATSKLTNSSPVGDVLDAMSQLEGQKAKLSGPLRAGNSKAVQESQVYNDVLDHLHSTLDSSGVNEAVKNYTVSPDLAGKIQQNVSELGGSPKLAQHYIDTLDNARSYSDVRSGMQMGQVAGNLNRVAKETFASSVPEAGAKKVGAGIPSWELAMAVHNPAYLTAAAGRLATNAGIADRITGRLNPRVFSAARDQGLAPDAITADKLNRPGVGGAPAVTSAKTSPMSIEAATHPAQTAPPVTNPSSVQEPSGAGGIGSDITAAPAPPEPTQVPVSGDNTNGSVPVNVPASPLDQALLKVGAGAHQIAGAVQPVLNTVDDAARNAASAIPGAVGGAVRGVAGVPGQTAAALTNPSNLGSLIGQATGEAASSVGQNPNASVPSGATAGVDLSAIDQLTQQASDADNPQPTLDPSTIPGGTLADLEQEITADPKNASVYKEIYDEAQKQVAASAPQKLNATEAKNLTNIQNATAALHNYVQGLNSLSDSTRGAGVGQLSALLGKIGLGGANATTAAQLESNKEELAIQLAQAMNNGNKPQGAQIEQIKNMLPSVNDPKALAARKIDQLSTNLSDYLNIASGASVANRSSGNTSSLLAGLTGGQ